MPYSYDFGKPEAIDFILKNTTTESKILDVGAGIGTYSILLNPHGYSMDCLEIYKGYVEAYNLKEKYKNVYIGNVVDFDLSDYDFVIIGDVLEHLSIEDANIVLKKCKNVIVAVPYMLAQDGVDFVENGFHLVNEYERHLQEDLNPSIMESRYPMLELVWNNELYGYYSNIKN